jgi:hypothetical protein
MAVVGATNHARLGHLENSLRPVLRTARSAQSRPLPPEMAESRGSSPLAAVWGRLPIRINQTGENAAFCRPPL